MTPFDFLLIILTIAASFLGACSPHWWDDYSRHRDLRRLEAKFKQEKERHPAAGQ